MSDERKAPETPPEYPPETTGTRWLSIAEVEALIGKKERNARYWLDRHDIPSRGERPKLFSERAILDTLEELGQGERKAPETPPEHIPEATGSRRNIPPETTGTPREPIEAGYRLAPEDLRRAIESTGQKYVTDFAQLYDRISADVGRLYEGQLAAKDETIATQRAALATKDQALAADALAIAQLRRRAEAAEAEAAHRQDETTELRALLHRQGTGSPVLIEEEPAGLWARLGHWWRGH